MMMIRISFLTSCTAPHSQVVLNVAFYAYAARAFFLEFHASLVWLLDTDGDGSISREEIVDYFRGKWGFVGPLIASLASVIVYSKIVSVANVALKKSTTVAK